MTPQRNAKLKRVLPVLAWAALILLVSTIPKPLETTPSEMSSFLLNLRVLGVGGVTLVSFIIHFALYAVLGFLTGRALMLKSHQGTSAVSRQQGLSGKPSPYTFLLGLVLCTTFGLADELYQVGVPGRGFEWVDLLADGLGALVGLSIFAVRHRAQEESN